MGSGPSFNHSGLGEAIRKTASLHPGEATGREEKTKKNKKNPQTTKNPQNRRKDHKSVPGAGFLGFVFDKRT